MDEEFEEQETRPARLNWADVAYVSLWPLRGFVEGVSNMCSMLQSSLAMHSTEIGDRQDFAKSAGRAIESLNVRED